MKKSLKNVLNCCKLFKNKTRLGNNFQGSDSQRSYVVYKFQRGLCNESYYGECVRHLNVKIGKHIGISSLTKKQVKPTTRSIDDHLPFHNNSASYDDFCILIRENKKILLKLNDSLLIMRDKPLAPI